jgi:hypothetical protein
VSDFYFKFQGQVTAAGMTLSLRGALEDFPIPGWVNFPEVHVEGGFETDRIFGDIYFDFL